MVNRFMVNRFAAETDVLTSSVILADLIMNLLDLIKIAETHLMR